MVLIYPITKNKKDYSLKDISNDLRFIRFERNTWTGHLVDQTIRSNKLAIREGMELNSVEAIIELVRQGLGYAIVPKLANIAWDTDKHLRISELPGKTIFRKVGLLERKKHGRQKITQVIKQHFLSILLKNG
jgi:DNA-binding transcriptional LysR family regulator